MYTPVISQFQFSGRMRLLGYVLLPIGLGLVGLSFIIHLIDISLLAWAWFGASFFIVLLSFMPALTWARTKFTYRRFAVARARGAGHTAALVAACGHQLKGEHSWLA